MHACKRHHFQLYDKLIAMNEKWQGHTRTHGMHDRQNDTTETTSKSLTCTLVYASDLWSSVFSLAWLAIILAPRVVVHNPSVHLHLKRYESFGSTRLVRFQLQLYTYYTDNM